MLGHKDGVGYKDSGCSYGCDKMTKKFIISSFWFIYSISSFDINVHYVHQHKLVKWSLCNTVYNKYD